ncbi:hypothetical protein GCM10009712_02010 [Pseudarthrobacter sulfonivorans]|uniref:hypothetical protein n=1 Tax=Pseudarthrobacter sulfonivorans TaxID=121292 RepID=UPI00168B24C0|nr:hypothetical protein [Pseudarthrobacter sulfonivorans]
MSLSRRLLYASEIWEVARPRTALTAGHLIIRLSNPAVAFDPGSAADWLLCHDAARQALADVLGATRCTVLFAHQWHPLGAAIGEPEVESSTPTFHLFGRWDGETVTPGEQLLLPAQRRVPVAPEELVNFDDGLRAALRRAAVERAAGARWQFEAMPGSGTAANCHLAEPDPLGGALPEILMKAPEAKAGRHHTVLCPASLSEASYHALTPGHLLALAAAVQELTDCPGVTGLSCVVPDPGAGPLEVHALGRSAGESVNPLQEFLSIPKVSQALL